MMKERPEPPDLEEDVLTPWEEEAGASSRLGMLLFLASLTMFFGASIVAYLAIRLDSPLAPPPGHLVLPSGLWVSTFLLLLTGWSIHVADRRARHRAGDSLRRWLGLSLGCGVAFVAVQVPCLLELLRVHRVALAHQGGAIYGLTFSLVVMHALHVLGGIAPLAALTFGAWGRGAAVVSRRRMRGCALYWHFLEVVWIALFGVLQITA
jgi:heme/copper-type cytochrome/quinol oxidase subunit 3